MLETFPQLGLIAYTYSIPVFRRVEEENGVQDQPGPKTKKNKQPGSRVLFQHLFQREPEREGYSPNAALGSIAAAFELEKGVALAVLFPFVSPSRGFPPAPLPNPENPPPPPEGTTKPLKPLKAPPLSD